MCLLECADVLVDVDTHRSWLTHSWCTHAWHSQATPVPHAHVDMRSHPGRHDAQALPGPDTRPARRRLEIPIRPGLHKHGLETAPAEHAAGWGSTVANGVVGFPTLLCLALPSPCLCPEVSSGIFHFMEKPQDCVRREMFWAQDPSPRWAPSPCLNIFSHARRSLSAL